MEKFKVGDIVWVDNTLMGEVLFVDDSGYFYQIQIDHSFNDEPTVKQCSPEQLSEFISQEPQGLPF